MSLEEAEHVWSSRVITRRTFYQQALGGAAIAALNGSMPAASAAQSTTSPIRMTVSGNQILLDGRPWRGIGINFYDALTHNDVGPSLSELAESRIPFIRVGFDYYSAANSDGSWHGSWSEYLQDPSGWWQKRRSFLDACHAHGIGVIASMFWRYQTVPDLMRYWSMGNGKRDALDQWGNSDSLTRKFMRMYTAECVSKFRQHPAIWGWEFGNEATNAMLFSGPHAQPLPPKSTAPGGPAAYLADVGDSGNGASDIVRWPDVFAAYQDWHNVVTSIDYPGRLLSSGQPLPTANFNGIVTHSHTQPDTYPEWMHIPQSSDSTVPAPVFCNPKSSFNVISAHVYMQTKLPAHYFSDSPSSKILGPAGVVSLLQQIANQDNRPLAILEFGSLAGEIGQDGNSGTDGTLGGERRYFSEILQAIVYNKVQISALWNYGYGPSNSVRRWNVDPGTARDYQLQALRIANQHLTDAT